MYYDVVCSVYRENDNGCDTRVDAHLLCGGFHTDDDAMQWIDTHDCTKYDNCCSKNEYTCIEIETHLDDGTISSVETVD
jgi:hypothetical protein